MHWRLWGICVVFLMALVATSCRNTVDPDTDRNRPPDTYLTAAPIDSIAGGPLSKIPYRYHAHWSGADIDGEVVGFFVAVTETIPPEGATPVRLPPPKPQDYKFTTKRDSVFVFNIHEGLGTDREHGLYVYAIDNEGKVDPEPAFVHFIARDRNLPGLNFLAARAWGTMFRSDGMGGVVSFDTSFTLTDNIDPVGATVLPRDTIPVGASAYFAWQGWDDDWNSVVIGYRYKLFEPEFNAVDSTIKEVWYADPDHGAIEPIPIGPNLFRVKSVDEAGGTTLEDSLRRFIVNFDSDTWWAGPDTTDPAIQAALLSDVRGRYIPAADVTGAPPAELDRWLGPTRFDILPSERTPSKTFVEKTKIGAEFRFYIRADGDSVARNAEVLYLFAGGFDGDSPYDVLVSSSGQGIGRVGMPDGPNGSPIGSEFRVINRFKTGARNLPSWSVVHPNFNPLSAGFAPDTYFESSVFNTSVAYAQARSVDGNTGKDGRIRDALNFGEDFCWDDVTGEPWPGADNVPLCTLIQTWVTNYNPYFLTDVPAFTPSPDTLILDPIFDARLFMFDPDSTTQIGTLADFLVRVRFSQPGGNPLPDNFGWEPEDGFRMKTGSTFQVSIPPDLPPGKNLFEFELSDVPGDGQGQRGDRLEDRRTVIAKIPFYWQVVQ
jgi:hypothetical protein